MSEPVFDPNSSTRIWDLLTSLKTWVKGLLGSLPLRVAAGRISENQMAQPYTKRIYFPEGRFTQIPIVIVTMNNAASGTDGLQVAVAAVTASWQVLISPAISFTSLCKVTLFCSDAYCSNFSRFGLNLPTTR